MSHRALVQRRVGGPLVFTAGVSVTDEDLKTETNAASLSRFTLTAQSLFQIKRQLDKLGELVLKVTYESDPIQQQKPLIEERIKYLLYNLIKR